MLPRGTPGISSEAHLFVYCYSLLPTFQVTLNK